MALVKTTINDQIGGLFYIDEAVNATKVTMATSGTYSLHQIEITNTANSHKVYLKIYGSDPTVGNTDPDCIFPCEAAASAEYSFSDAIGFTDIYYAVTQEAGTGGNSDPTNAITVKFLLTSA